MLRVKNNRPTYSPFWAEYIVEWSLDGEKFCKPVGTYADGIAFLRDSFPEWYKKHYEGHPKPTKNDKRPLPRFIPGEQVKCSLNDKLLTIKEEPSWNGFTWMYAFEGEEMRCGQDYLTPPALTLSIPS